MIGGHPGTSTTRGHLRGELYTDDLTLEGFMVSDVQFIVRNSSTSEEIPGASNADIGMDYTTKSMTGTAGFFETLIIQKKVREPEFAFWIARSHGSLNSELVLGDRDTTKFTGDPIVANVTSQNYWTIYIDGASVNRANINSLTGGTAIIDTGNPGISCNLCRGD